MSSVQMKDHVEVPCERDELVERCRELFHERGMAFDEISLGHDASLRSVRAITGRETVPQVFIDGEYIGGSEELEAYFAEREQNAA